MLKIVFRNFLVILWPIEHNMGIFNEIGNNHSRGSGFAFLFFFFFSLLFLLDFITAETTDLIDNEYFFQAI